MYWAVIPQSAVLDVYRHTNRPGRFLEACSSGACYAKRTLDSEIPGAGLGGVCQELGAEIFNKLRPPAVGASVGRRVFRLSL